MATGWQNGGANGCYWSGQPLFDWSEQPLFAIGADNRYSMLFDWTDNIELERTTAKRAS